MATEVALICHAVHLSVDGDVDESELRADCGSNITCHSVRSELNSGSEGTPRSNDITALGRVDSSHAVFRPPRISMEFISAIICAFVE